MNLLSKPIYIIELTTRQQQEIAKAVVENKGNIPEIILKNSPYTGLQGKHIQRLLEKQMQEVAASPYLLVQKMFVTWFNLFKYPKGKQ